MVRVYRRAMQSIVLARTRSSFRSKSLTPFPVINRVKPCRHGMMIYNIHDQYIGRSLDLYGEWSKGEMDLMGQMIFPGMAVVEAGGQRGPPKTVFGPGVGPGGFVPGFVAAAD